MTPARFDAAVQWLEANMVDLALRRLQSVGIRDYHATPDAPEFQVGEGFSRMADLAAEARRTGSLPVWDGGSEDTIYTSPEVNYAFRAWHDGAHVAAEAGFTREGELLTYGEQLRDVINVLWQRSDERGRLSDSDAELLADVASVLDAEINGQLDYLARTGSFPSDQRSLVRGLCIT